MNQILVTILCILEYIAYCLDKIDFTSIILHDNMYIQKEPYHQTPFETMFYSYSIYMYLLLFRRRMKRIVRLFRSNSISCSKISFSRFISLHRDQTPNPNGTTNFWNLESDVSLILLSLLR